MVLRTVLLMLAAVEPQTLDAYREKVKYVYNVYGSAKWALLYQAETRMRRDHFVRLYRRGSDEHSKAEAADKTHDFDPNRPWEWVFSEATKGK